jgi:radical SAM superfamily enzyme YgiQ (UPF0313 family)
MNESAEAAAGILLATINAKWIHPSLALRLLKTNLGPLEKNCRIIEFALRQPLREKIEPILEARPRILGLSVSIWNHTATLELLKKLRESWEKQAHSPQPVIVLGGPEVSYLPGEAEIFRYADYCIRGEGEIAFRELCAAVLNGEKPVNNAELQQVDVAEIKTAFHLYTDEDVGKKLIYVEASRGCPFGCEFCLSTHSQKVREFPLEPFLAEMDDLIRRGVKTFKFLDRSFNLNIERARRIMEFFLGRMAERPFVVHFEMIPSRFPPELIETLVRFPPGSLRLEIGIQTLNHEVSARIGRPSEPERELETLRLLREKTNAIIHADLIAGLPGEDLVSFGRGFDQLWMALSLGNGEWGVGSGEIPEIQLGILKLLPGAPISRHNEAFGMRYNPSPPYEVRETASLSINDLDRIKNFARFWQLIVDRGLLSPPYSPLPTPHSPIFDRFMTLSDALAARFGQNWGIDKHELQEAVNELF